MQKTMALLFLCSSILCVHTQSQAMLSAVRVTASRVSTMAGLHARGALYATEFSSRGQDDDNRKSSADVRAQLIVARQDLESAETERKSVSDDIDTAMITSCFEKIAATTIVGGVVFVNVSIMVVASHQPLLIPVAVSGVSALCLGAGKMYVHCLDGIRIRDEELRLKLEGAERDILYKRRMLKKYEQLLAQKEARIVNK